MRNTACPLFFFILAVAFGGCETPEGERSPGAGAQDVAFAELVDLVGERLELMYPAAQYKWNNGLQVEGAGRDEAALARAVEEGEGRGLPPFVTESFFLVQMEAGRLLQQVYFEDWEDDAAGSFDLAADYESELLPDLDRIELEMIEALAQVHAAPPSEDRARERIEAVRERLLNSDRFPEEIVEIAMSPFAL